ncbi:hypothetical protein BGW39_003015, partial [Mortierella sp. 14UC]
MEPHSVFDDCVRPSAILELETLAFRLPCSSSSTEFSEIGGGSGGGYITCWSSLVLLQEFSFDDNRQTL